MPNKNAELIQFNLRLPVTTANILRKTASKNSRSMNSEIVNILEDRIRALSSGDSSDDVKKSLKELISEICLISKKVSNIIEKNPSLKEEFLSDEQRNVLEWLDSLKPNERDLMINSLPELLSLVKKLN